MFHRVDAIFVHLVPEELERCLSKFALFAVDYQTIRGQDFENLFEVLQMFLWSVGSNEYVVNVDETVGKIA